MLSTVCCYAGQFYFNDIILVGGLNKQRVLITDIGREIIAPRTDKCFGHIIA